MSAAPALRRPLTRLEGVTEMMQASGYQVTNRVLSVAVGRPSDDERKVLQLSDSAEVIRLERLRMRGDEAYIYWVDVLPRSYFAEDISAIDWRGSCWNCSSSGTARPIYAVAQISAIHLPRELWRRYGLDTRIPWLLMVQVNTTEEGVSVIYSHDYHRGDRFTFDVPRRSEQRA